VLNIFLEYIKRNSTTGIYEIGTRPKNRLTVKLVDLFRKIFANPPTGCRFDNLYKLRNMVVRGKIDQ
jgi:hypothetical protein